MTPEGRVKRNIRRVLDSFENVYYFMPVQNGLGPAGVDFHCVVKMVCWINGTLEEIPVAFFIEAKKPGGEPTERQKLFIKDRKEKQNAHTFVIDDDPSIAHNSGKLEKLVEWLQNIEDNNERARARLASADISVSG